jgi:hypothetical protein
MGYHSQKAAWGVVLEICFPASNGAYPVGVGGLWLPGKRRRNSKARRRGLPQQTVHVDLDGVSIHLIHLGDCLDCFPLSTESKPMGTRLGVE